MSASLNTVWDAHLQASDALKVVRRAVGQAALTQPLSTALQGTAFYGLPAPQLDLMLDALQDHMDDQAVLSLYATFESLLRDHLIAQAVHLGTYAVKPDASFGMALASLYEEWCDDRIPMDKVAKLFLNAAGKVLVDQVGQIRKYRHWVAHGKRDSMPSHTTPSFAFKTLDSFLSKI